MLVPCEDRVLMQRETNFLVSKQYNYVKEAVKSVLLMRVFCLQTLDNLIKIPICGPTS
jgi:hypothetical protein